MENKVVDDLSIHTEDIEFDKLVRKGKEKKRKILTRPRNEHCPTKSYFEGVAFFSILLAVIKADRKVLEELHDFKYKSATTIAKKLKRSEPFIRTKLNHLLQHEFVEKNIHGNFRKTYLGRRLCRHPTPYSF